MVSKLEKNVALPTGDEERFSGYGVMGLTFKSGHVLALRRFIVSSIGPGYRAVWHRNPQGEWTFYADVEPSQSCARYFGEYANEAIIEKIDITWIANNRLRVEIKNIGFQWDITLTSTPMVRLLNLVAGIIPVKFWKDVRILKLISQVAAKILKGGRIELSGYVPNRQRFIANPYKIWLVSESTASLGRMDFGEPAPLKQQEHLKDFWIPQRGMFVLGRSYFEPFDKDRHSAIYSNSDSTFQKFNERQTNTA